MKTIGVGIIGASSGGWASLSHLPALRALDGFEVRAVATTRQASAEAAAAEYGVPLAFDNDRDLVSHPDVDLVVVAVKVPYHRPLVSTALAAGKTVYCEWPLGVSLGEAESLTADAAAAQARTVIGLQARNAPVIRYVRDLVEEGFVGRVLGTTMVGSGVAWGPETTGAQAYTFDASQGATALTVPAMHAVDALNFVLGDFTEVTARLGTARPEVHLSDTGEVRPVTAPDQIAISGALGLGAVASVYYRGAFSRGDNFHWEINGTRGDLVLTADGPNGNLQVADLRLQGGRDADTGVTEMPVPDAYYGRVPRTLTGPAHNVAQTYAALAEDLRAGTSTVAGFDHALRQHRLIDAIETSARTGTVRTLG
ncbi:Gfo/Idh/MocA family protein [Actinacidiphila acidipaludis]|uniref:Gfo/Idh/MocA family oxidoreductase n=1 Tax=Actinacidiphila acidipaludis TaxID=2873382 RepID=A0ABS7QH33_9ACTN|nr:Gfo/Idh/MocA family oxidoreductase [Streptomyces acidipaludis]MBY8881084.1 Gfo/Idh/MocA family oxidoreductase [Streptomyces acidipaludis]